MTGTPFIETLLESNLRAALLLGIVYGALRILNTGDGGFRHRVWLTALTGCLLLPLLGAVVPPLAIPILPAPAPGPDPLAATLSFAGDDVAGDPGFPKQRAWLGGLWLWVYGTGVAGVLGLFIVSVCRMARLERGMAAWQGTEALCIKDAACAELGIRRPVRLLESDAAGSPFTWRVWRPSVVLPSAAGDWSPDQMRNALLHELCHVKRFDWAWLWLLRIAAAIYWFNPLVWIAMRECRFEAERACDDFVLGAGGESSDYAEHLVDLMASSRTNRGIGIALGGGFPKRIRAILNASQEVREMGRIRKSVITSATALLVTVLAACQVTTGQAISDEDATRAERAAEEAARQSAEQLAQQAEQEQRLIRDEQERRERQRQEQDVARQRELASEESTRRMYERIVQLERLLQERRAGVESGERATEEQRLQLAELAQALDQRTADLREREVQMERLAQTVERLQMTVDQQNAQLLEAEHALAQLQAQLAEPADQ